MRLIILLVYILLLGTFSPIQQLLAQTPLGVVQLEVKGNRNRIPFDLSGQQTYVELRNLIQGNTYQIIAIPVEKQSDRLHIKLSNKYEEEASAMISNLNRPQSRRWKATASTVLLIIEKPIGSTLSNQAYLSVACESCQGESNWIDKFMDQAESVISTTGGISASSLISNTLIGGDCIKVANITSSGPANSQGIFNNGSTSIGIDNGVLLCTGNVSMISGPNTSNSSEWDTTGFNINFSDDPDLALLTTGDQWDISKIEFDFTPFANQIQFDFVFGSEEYCDFVGSSFNDVIGFFICGPGIPGIQNIALLPGSASPVSINNINHLTNSIYYINNNTFSNCGGLGAAAIDYIALDGYTTVMTAKAELIPGETYHIKLAIADVGDGNFSSAVFLRANSFDVAGGCLENLGCNYINLDRYVGETYTSTCASPSCFIACPNNQSTYFFTPKDSSTYTWEVQGGTYTVLGDGSAVEVNWADSTDGLLFLYETNVLQEVKVHRFCVDVLDAPVAGFEFETHQSCTNNPIQLINTTSQATDYLWDFGDGTTSTERSPTHQYNHAGTYTITLYVSKNNLDSSGYALCTCFDTISHQIIIDPLPGVDIHCISTLCTKDEVEYWTTASNCQLYKWTVVDAQGQQMPFTGQGTDRIFVQWGEGPTGTVSLEVQSCDESYCSQPTRVEIDIITDSVMLEGKVRVCEKSVEVYRAQKWATVDYHWEVSGGEILSGQGSPVLTVRWDSASTTAQLRLAYSSPFIGGVYEQNPTDCSGTTVLDIQVLSQFSVNLPYSSIICTGGSSIITATSEPWDAYNWTITPPVPFSGQGTDSIFVQWGPIETNYVITAVPTDSTQYCTLKQTRFISTVDLLAPQAILGPSKICQGSTYSYSAVTSNTGVGFTWQVTGGVIIEYSNNQVMVTWNPDGPYALSVQQYFQSAPDCISSATSLPVQNVLSDTSWAIDGAPACLNTTKNYQISSELEPNASYTWSIEPSTMGTITQGQGNSAVMVQWGALTGPAILRVTVELCGVSFTKDKIIDIASVPVPVIQQLGDLCPGSSVELDAGGGFVSYSWSNFDSTQITSIFDAGNYWVTVVDANGCSAVGQYNATALPSPVANITREELQHCIEAPSDSFVIRAVIGDGYQFRWYRGGSYLPTPTDQDTFVHYFTNQPGVSYYWVEVTNSLGCSAKSEKFVIIHTSCSPPVADTCFPQSFQFLLEINESSPDCNTINFDVTKSDNVVISSWDFQDDPDTTNTGIYPDAQHRFDRAGSYLVEVKYLIQSVDSSEYCHGKETKEVRIPLIADYYFKRNCRDFEFYDYSTYLRNKHPISWFWDFGDGSSSTLKDPVHSYSTGGTYQVSLTVMNMDSCISTITREIQVSFDLSSQIIATPSPACEGQPVQFSTEPSAIQQVFWSFGNGQTSTAFNPATTFTPAGLYSISAFVKDTFGCIDTAFLELTLNALIPLQVDTIAWSPSLGVCIGDSVLLSAPLGLGYQYSWSNHSTAPEVFVNQSGQYGLTVYDSNGCKHALDPVSVTVSDYPVASISGRPYVCGDGCTTFSTLASVGYSYAWFANGVPVPVSNKPDIYVCDHTLSSPYTVEVTNAYGCSTTSSPFTVEAVSPPEFAIQVTPAPCEGDTVQLSVMPVQPGVVYTWSTGAVDTSIQVRQKGIYVVTGVDSVTGCSAYAAQEVYPLPDLCYMPFGCYETCNPDTLFLPFIPGQDSVSWYYNGSVVSNHPSFLEVTQDGTYSVEVTTIHGCSDRSKEVSIDVVTGFGNLTANLWSDVNDNGVVDAVDTLLTGIPLQLQLNGVFIDTVASLGQVAISWLKLPESVYSVLVDTAQLPVDWVVLIGQDSVSIIGCDQSFEVNLLVDYVCPNLQTTVELSACEGSSADYQGTAIPAGSTQQFTYLTQLGCDSVVQVQVLALPNTSATLSNFICPGDTLFYQGVAFTGVATQTFQLTTQQGCDSTVLLQVGVYPTYSDTLEVAVCNGAQFVFQNTALSPGQSQQFTLQSVHGCDSIITVIVGTLPASLETLNVSTCPGEPYLYEGVSLQAGQSQTFQYTNAAGCDSLVLVQVAALPSSADSLEVSVCPGSTYTYESVALSVGQSQLFSFTNTVGCDSTVMVQVAAYPSYTQTQEVFICPGETYTYQGQSLAVGQTQAFTFNTVNGCDSTLTVQVMASPSSSDTLEVSVCKDDAYSYGNQLINAGTSQLFEYSNVWGCDSSVLVQVMAYPELEYQYNSKPTCPNIQTGGIEVSVIGGPVSGLSYSLNGSVFDTLARFRLLEEGDYTVSVKDFNGCIQEEEVTIPTYPPLEIVLPEELVIPCDSNQIEIRPGIVGDTTDLEFIWSNGSRSPSYFASDIGPVTVRAKNACRETAYKTTQIQWVDELRAPVPLYVPNIFSPAGQSPENSVFRTFFGTNFAVESYRLEVYDRFGSLVFVTEDVEGSWGGEFNNRPLGDGVYVWKLEASVRICGKVRKVERSGDVMIAR